MFGNSQYKNHYKNGFKYLKISKGDNEARAVVLLHGMFGGLSNYDSLIKHIDGYNIFVPAIPVYDSDFGKVSIQKLTDWLHTFLQTMELNGPILLGNSMGGHLALDYTIRHPENVSSLILTGSSGVKEKDFGSTFPRRSDRAYIRKQAELTFYDDRFVTEEVVDDIIKIITHPSKLRNILTIARDTHEYNMEQFLENIRHEVLLIWGKNDKVTPPDVARQFHRGLPNSRLKWIDQCGHAPMMEHPQKFARFLNEFLTEQKNKSKKKIITDYEENYSHL